MSNYSEAAEGTLVIMVCRAKHLPNRRKLDKQSPYVLLRINTTAKKTPIHFRAGQTPEWTFEIRFKLSRDRKPIMRLDVLDETKNDPTPIGGTEIDCSRVFLDPANLQDGGKYIWDSWHDLQFRDKPAGKIYLEMTFYPSAPIVPPKVGFSSPGSVSRSLHEDEEPAFRHLAPAPLHSDEPDDVFVTNDLKRHNKFHVSDSSHQFDSHPLPVGAKKQNTLGRLKEKFRTKETFSNIWTSGSKQNSSYVQEIPLHGKESFAFSSLPPVTLQDIESGVPPPPPPHSEYSLITPSLQPERRTPEPVFYQQDSLLPPPAPPVPPKAGLVSPVHRSSNRSPVRKPPPVIQKLDSKENSTLIPFSAETFGLDDHEDDLPTAVFHMGQQVKSLTVASRNKNEPSKDDDIDPKHYAPTPSEHLAKSLRLQNGQVDFKDIQVDLKTEQTGYLGEGKWDMKRFSPSVFDRIHDGHSVEEKKPTVPPKIPQGLSEREYYVLDKENYLKDINGRRI